MCGPWNMGEYDAQTSGTQGGGATLRATKPGNVAFGEVF
jgi:hypothetical protein